MTPDQQALLRKATESLDAAKLLADQRYYDLIEAHGSRNVGDYDIRTRTPAAEADKQIDRARMFLELGERLLGV